MKTMINHATLHTFLTVYRLGSQTKAAVALHLTQPAVFQHLKSLEAQIGKPLFKREGKYIRATLVGHQLALSLAPHMLATPVINSI